ncbi:MAG: HPr(Ser) kinase/phosphatase [Candidatus Raymondbacteria bacterium RifOxyA12_full_50_37]|uniref:HPr kinase/phosphorylase n=1 Tax=Candidatus Raymondbacteria bacterium RIFOXYD12_FULL_49_13 TaxID=1817890 RepID=A0A1F7FBX9_UNCRA|nr:MAG: HPr(Ser) kinase/phosphatase [Candidatus Raymondbacteria bacterium RifOxyA12_full_50_37]OGJ92543.1 MAG: HPr(Ser) kinase/phosphatase [Candidatus Raymondbacteria bacterium RIFOXYA2_FULL_49_16]OGJ97897.1 MAG: HPr(Ser) kinase/phosphatase [Candidatus Raymondbacteria bacterium RIFOXYC2_FULL_50_21]OGK00518.1 MAG: HPr(Ser) kinase/phosphatase [Candidatus Raymondbacteria bacterium RifOxyB12_full_50_8]OGK03986.1 MAG: HPr(Ser) kinase/phosphatase [Candidatus Raymondbacteria bacterium RIFOXYD12_FULL_4
MGDFVLSKKKQSITADELFSKNADLFKTRFLTGKKGLGRKIESHEIHYPALALTGFLDRFAFKKIQFISEIEWHYLGAQSPARRKECVAKICEFAIPAIVVTRGRKVHNELFDACRKFHVPFYSTPLSSQDLHFKMSDFLEEYFAPRITLHSSLVDVYGIGLLYTGKSGIGKSECVLDLVERGHRLVADDIVTVMKKGNTLIGSGSPLLGHHMEIRGVGIINIEALFGVRAIRMNKKIEVMVELVEWGNSANYERLGLDETTTGILDVPVDKITIPIFPGKNITVISEVIAMNKLLKMNGINSAAEFNQRLLKTLQNKQQSRSGT